MDFSTLFINISLALFFIIIILVYVIFKNKYTRQELKEALLNANIAKDKFQRLIDYSETIIFTHDLSGKIDFINNTVRDLLGLNPLQLIGTSFKALLAKDNDRNWDDYMQALFSKKGIEREFDLLNQQGQRVSFLIYARGIVDDGNVVAVKGHAKLSKTYKARPAVVDEAPEHKVKKKPDPIQYHLAHDIKNIFSAIRGFAEIIAEEKPKTASMKTALKEINGATIKGVELIGDFVGEKKPKRPSQSENMPNQKRSLLQGKGHILYIDDEKSLLKMYSKFIQRLGYTVDAFALGFEGLKALEANSESYGLIITDWTLPDISGGQLIDKISSNYADIPLILISGKSLTNQAHRNVNKILQKPVDPVELSQSIHDIFSPSKTTS